MLALASLLADHKHEVGSGVDFRKSGFQGGQDLMLVLASLLADHKHEVPNQMYNLTQPRSFETFEDGMTCESWMRLMLGCTI